MKDQDSSIVFDQQRASAYDKRFAKLAPVRDALHLLTRMAFSDLGGDARVLCVGVGTGSELIYLAQAFPRWQFTAVEPAAPMLDVCRRRTAELGIASRCAFHEGYLDSLPLSDPFQAATCLLVSQFLVKETERRRLFRDIAARLVPDGHLVTADLAADMSTSSYQSLLKAWLRMLRYAETPAEEIEKMLASYGRDVALLPPRQIEAMIAASGFDAPVLFFQALLMHAWHAKRAPATSADG